MMSTEIPEIPPEVQALIGKPQYEEETEFEIAMGYVSNTCAAVQNGNPLYWNRQATEEITHGQIAPPTMLSVWFRPHFWSPGADGERIALQTHFDLKRLLGLPEAIVSANEMVFGEPVRMADKLKTHQIIRSISDVKNTKLGPGRFWVVDVEIENQRGEYVGTDSYTCLGYRRPDS